MGERTLDTLVLAFDLGTRETGWVLVDAETKILHLGYWKALNHPLNFRLRDLLFALHAEMADMQFGEHPVGELPGKRILVAYEAPYMEYARPALALSQAVGILKAGLWQIAHGVDPEFIEMPMEISIAEAKLALTGRGNASKEMVLDMARKLSGYDELNQHQADAYAVACAAWGKLHQEAMLDKAKRRSAPPCYDEAYWEAMETMAKEEFQDE